jgi:hypothetical protein
MLKEESDAAASRDARLHVGAEELDDTGRYKT